MTVSATAPGTRVSGRLVAVLSPHKLLFDDGAQEEVLTLAEPLPAAANAPRPGDFITATLVGAKDGGRLAHDLCCLARRPAATPFPDPQGDWYRLQRDGRRRLVRLRERARLLRAIRDFFDERDFLEIEAPLAVPSPGLELHLAAFSVEPGGRFLITSPEYQCKRLLTGGLSRIYSIGKVFRHGESGPHHNPEFTMLEWYRAYEGWRAIAADVAKLCAALASSLHGSPCVQVGGRRVDLSTPWPELSVSEAMARYANVQLRGDESVDELRACLRAGSHRLPPVGATWDDLFFGVFLDHVEPRLAELSDGTADAALRPVVLYDWPKPLCALARPHPENPAVVERFEAYIAGLELCNGFGELCDPHEQRQRLLRDLEERTRRGLPRYPIDERFLDALTEGMPPSAGVALGVDRLAMLLCGASHIREVLPFSSDEL